MAILLYRIGAFAARRHFVMIGVWVLIVVAATLGGKAFVGEMTQAVEIPGTESQSAIDELEARFPQASGASTKVIFVAPEGQNIHAFVGPIGDVVTQLAKLDHVVTVTSPFADGAASQIGVNNSMAYVNVQYSVAATDLTSSDQDAIHADANAAASSGLTVAFAGIPPGDESSPAPEIIALLLALVILAITFGSLLTAGMPIITAALGVSISLLSIGIFSAFVTISSTAPVLASMLGLAVGIDYALFIVSRHRSQLAAGMAVRESIAIATSTAGSAVVFAGLTVIIALIGLSVVNIPFLSVMGLGAAFGVVLAIAVSVTLLPALLGLLGRRLIPKPTSRAARREREMLEAEAHAALLGAASREAVTAGSSAEESTAAAATPTKRPKPTLGRRWVGLITARPLITVLAVIIGLVIVALPAATMKLTVPDAGYQPEGSQARVGYDLLAQGFGPGFNGPLLVTADISNTVKVSEALAALEKQFTGVADVANVGTAYPNQALDMAIISITPSSSPDSEATTDLVKALRASVPAFEAANGFSYKVTGQTAVAIDISDRLNMALRPYALVVVGLCLVLLTMVFRSLAVPIMATLGFLLSVGASLGVVTVVFNWGWLASLIGVEKVGPVISFMPILVMAVLFGLAMDYQVFLVSRMREEFSKTGQAKESVLGGFSASARVVTAAALIMFSVFAAFVPTGGAVLQPLAGGLAVGVLIDAFLVRMTLIPAVMAMLGAHAWYLPKWLQRVVPNVDLEGEQVHELIAARQWHPVQPDAAGAAADADAGAAAAETSGETAATVVSAAPFAIGAGAFSVAGSAPVDLDVPEGALVLVTGVSATEPAAALAALTGRFEGHGFLTVLGLPQPFEAGALRRRSMLVLGLEADEPSMTFAEYLSTRARLDVRLTQRHDYLSAAERTLRRFESIAAPGVGTGIHSSTSLDALTPTDLWCVDVALAVASARPLIAVDTRQLDSAFAAAALAELCAIAEPTVTVVAAVQAEVAATLAERGLLGSPRTIASFDLKPADISIDREVLV